MYPHPPGEPLRVDCVMEFGFDGPENANVYVIVIRAERVSADVYSARLRSRYTKANSIQTSPAGFRPVLIQEFYRGTGFRYEPSRLARDDAGWGEPKLPELIRRQCALQPRLPCRR